MQQRPMQWEMEATTDKALLNLRDLQIGVRPSLSMGMKAHFIMHRKGSYVFFS